LKRGVRCILAVVKLIDAFTLLANDTEFNNDYKDDKDNDDNNDTDNDDNEDNNDNNENENENNNDIDIDNDNDNDNSDTDDLRNSNNVNGLNETDKKPFINLKKEDV